MSFLAGAFLAGLVTLAIPWWLHRREQQRQHNRQVSSLLLMRPGEEPEQARKTLRHRLLLAVRLTLLAVLALAFSQPVLEQAFSGAEQPASVLPRIITLDTSASMAADFSSARGRARSVIDSLPPGGRAAVVRVADAVVVAQSFTRDRGALHRAVEASTPGTGRLAFDGLLGRLSALAATLDGPAEVHLISDFQASALPAQFNGLLAGAGGPVVLHPTIADPANWLVEQVSIGDDVRVTVRGLNTPARALDVVLSTAQAELGRRALTVPAAGRASAAFALPESTTGDTGLRVVIDPGDGLPLDDRMFQVLRRPEPVPLPVFSASAAAGQRAYLTAAVNAAAPRFRPADEVAQGPVAVLVDPGILAPDRLRLLQRHLDNGGAVLTTVGPATRRAANLPLTGLAVEPGNLRDEPRGVVMVDRSHPTVQGFAAWHDVTVSRHLNVESDATGSVLLALDDGTPLLVEHRLAAGRVLTLMTALDPSWSTLVTRPAFVSFTADALSYLAEDSLPSAAVAGQPLAIPATNMQLFDTAGKRLLSLGDTVNRSSFALEDPGLYTLRTPGRERLLAVNPDPRESDLAPADPALLKRWQDASQAFAAPPRTADRAAEDGVSRLSLAPWLLAILMLLAVLEPIMANAATRAPRQGAPA